MDAAVAGALIGAASTLAATLGTQALTIIRHRQRDKAQLARDKASEMAAQREETRHLIEEAPYDLRRILNALDGLSLQVGVLTSGGLADQSALLEQVSLIQALADPVFDVDSKLSVRLPETSPLLAKLREGAALVAEMNAALPKLVQSIVTAPRHARPTPEAEAAVETLTTFRESLSASQVAVTAAARTTMSVPLD